MSGDCEIKIEAGASDVARELSTLYPKLVDDCEDCLTKLQCRPTASTPNIPKPIVSARNSMAASQETKFSRDEEQGEFSLFPIRGVLTEGEFLKVARAQGMRPHSNCPAPSTVCSALLGVTFGCLISSSMSTIFPCLSPTFNIGGVGGGGEMNTTLSRSVRSVTDTQCRDYVFDVPNCPDSDTTLRVFITWDKSLKPKDVPANPRATPRGVSGQEDADFDSKEGSGFAADVDDDDFEYLAAMAIEYLLAEGSGDHNEDDDQLF